MEKAYDLKGLLKHLENEGLNLAEDAASKVYSAVKNWATESAHISETPFDDLAIPFFKNVDEIVLPLIDKIDGEEG